ncbi:hypothetical protein L226DRAFT_428799, partial [Lentinus tigrinus ALCF2SS1-7]
TIPPVARTVPTARELYTQIVRTRYPDYQPQNDFELFVLGCDDLGDVEAEQLPMRLAREWSQFILMQGNDPAAAMACITELLEEPAEVTGVKPSPGDPDVVIIAIPGSSYSLRMWPGSLTRREYCLDFVYANNTDKSLKHPQGYSFDVYAPMSTRPWLGIGAQTLHSIEHNFGIPHQDVGEENEKIILRDGLLCVLTYTAEGGHRREVRFEVPVR